MRQALRDGVMTCEALHPAMRPMLTTLLSDTQLHANDRQGLERRCRYGARGILALERLSRTLPFLLSQEGEQAARVAPEAAARRELKKKRTPRLDWAASGLGHPHG